MSDFHLFIPLVPKSTNNQSGASNSSSSNDSSQSSSLLSGGSYDTVELSTGNDSGYSNNDLEYISTTSDYTKDSDSIPTYTPDLTTVTGDNKTTGSEDLINSQISDFAKNAFGIDLKSTITTGSETGTADTSNTPAVTTTSESSLVGKLWDNLTDLFSSDSNDGKTTTTPDPAANGDSASTIAGRVLDDLGNLFTSNSNPNITPDLLNPTNDTPKSETVLDSLNKDYHALTDVAGKDAGTMIRGAISGWGLASGGLGTIAVGIADYISQKADDPNRESLLGCIAKEFKDSISAVGDGISTVLGWFGIYIGTSPYSDYTQDYFNKDEKEIANTKPEAIKTSDDGLNKFIADTKNIDIKTDESDKDDNDDDDDEDVDADNDNDDNTIFDDVVDTVSDAFDDISDGISDIWDSITDINIDDYLPDVSGFWHDIEYWFS